MIVATDVNPLLPVIYVAIGAGLAYLQTFLSERRNVRREYAKEVRDAVARLVTAVESYRRASPMFAARRDFNDDASDPEPMLLALAEVELTCPTEIIRLARSLYVKALNLHVQQNNRDKLEAARKCLTEARRQLIDVTRSNAGLPNIAEPTRTALSSETPE